MNNGIILSLGTNLGDRIHNLKTALYLLSKHEIKVQKISPIYHSEALLQENAPAQWQLPYLNIAVLVQTDLSPFSLLQNLKKIEECMGRNKDAPRWSPRIIDLDILTYKNEILNTQELQLPHYALKERPFALWPLADLLPYWKDPLSDQTASVLANTFGSRFTAKAPYSTYQIPHSLCGPHILGILNVTPDSFSDAGSYVCTEKAFAQAKKLINDGALFLDIGAESTRPGAHLLSPQEEWERLADLFKLLHEKKHEFLFPPKISLDTRHAETIKKALNYYEISIINDVSGFNNADMVNLCKEISCDIILMHHLSIPADKKIVLPENIDPVQAVITWFNIELNRLSKEISPDRIILDVGLGFGKTEIQSLELLRSIEKFHQLNHNLLVGHSRKSFLSLINGQTAIQRDGITSIISAYLKEKQVHYLRVHNVESTCQALNTTELLSQKSYDLTDRMKRTKHK